MNILVITGSVEIFDRVKNFMEDEGHTIYFTPLPLGAITMIEAGMKDRRTIDIIFSHHPIHADLEARIKELLPDISIVILLRRKM